jgi:uncharacterized membrane protein
MSKANKKRHSQRRNAAVAVPSQKNKWLIPTISIVIIAVVAVVAIFALKGGDKSDENNNPANATSAVATEDSGNNNDTAQNADLVIPISEISTIAEFYPVEIEGTKLEVIAVEAPDGSIRTAFNTCQVCYDSGRGYYKQDGDVLVCQNCGNRFRMDQVEVQSGGCNPVPIFPENKIVTDESITISYDFLKESKGIFANWKAEY